MFTLFCLSPVDTLSVMICNNVIKDNRTHTHIYDCKLIYIIVCRKLNNNIERILKCVQTKQDRRRALQKPRCLPISTELDMQTFEMADEDIYEEVVSL